MVETKTEERLTRLETQMEMVISELRELRADMRGIRSGQRWIIGTQITMFVVLGGLIFQAIAKMQ